MPFINHPNGQTTHYLLDDFADPWTPHETILIQHGFGRNSNFWYKWIPIISKKYRVIRRDARGHGHSSSPTKEDYKYSIDTILDEIIDTLDQLKIDKVHYFGESTGGIWGEFLAARHPERLLSLTICSSPLYMPQAAQKMLAFGHTSWAEACRQLGSRGWGQALLDVTKSDQDAPPGFTEWWLEQFSIPSGAGLGDHAELLCDPGFDARKIMHQIDVPMLLLTPANSVLVNKEEQIDLNRAVAGSQLEIIPGHGHEIYLDQADLCQQKFLEFLGDLGQDLHRRLSHA
ncbi:hypothetical protein AC579_9422 [Pseudocercospora musae]|uniref:AB hydrolase-1 domain-containing protein n=1 Tax=Pseudocercospora musae TaxID=113226 RepID=A0A139I1W5_9PEZI|nr:hypothetical protein AC579_9422 [Pseudocercospora musae]